MGLRLILPAVVLAIGLSACGKSAPAPSGAPGGGTMQVNGSERLGWDQLADSRDDIARMRFVALVDTTKVELAGVSCSDAADTLVFSCSSRLPAMSAGPHTIQVIAINGSLESEPSIPPLSVVMVAGTPATLPSTRGAGEPGTHLETTADGVRLQVETLADDLGDVTDVAPAPGGTVFVAERAGRIRAYRDGALQANAAATLEGTISTGGELLSLAVDPAFTSNHFVFAVHTVAAAPEAERPREYRITRLREEGGALVDQVTLLAGVPATPDRAVAALRFGPDGKLYAALDSAGDARAAGDTASFNGKVLRLDADGTTPRDQAAATPVLAGSFQRPGALGWSKSGGVVWVGEARGDGSERLTPVVVQGRPVRAHLRESYALPAPFGIGGAALYTSAVVPEFEGNLFVGAEAGRYLLRLRFDPSSPLIVASTERLLVTRAAAIRAVAAGADGAIYVATRSALLRLAR